VSYVRTVPARKPEGHTAAAPRYGLRWHKPITAIISDYFAIQAPGLSWGQQEVFFEHARRSFAQNPDSFEIMRATDESQATNAIVVAYWVDPVKHARWSNASTLVNWFKSADRLSGAIGAWRETISVPYDRHETIYSEPCYKTGYLYPQLIRLIARMVIACRNRIYAKVKAVDCASPCLLTW
jgi:aldoxime dehydratase